MADDAVAGVDGAADGGVVRAVPRVVRIDVEGEDLVRNLPSGFLSAYIWLISLSRVSSGLSANRAEVGRAQARRVTRLSTGQTETRGGARSARAGLSQRNVIADERALAIRQRVDRKLRAIGRDVMAALNGDGLRSGNRRCTRCRKYAEADWNWCPYDGAATEEIT